MGLPLVHRLARCSGHACYLGLVPVLLPLVGPVRGELGSFVIVEVQDDERVPGSHEFMVGRGVVAVALGECFQRLDVMRDGQESDRECHPG